VIDHTYERQREADEREARAIVSQQAQLSQRLTVISRRAEARGYGAATGCTSAAQWLAQITSSDYGTAARITQVAKELDELPALDRALCSGELNFDQVAAASRHATPATDAELARLAIGKPPRQIAHTARTLNPPTIADDATLYTRRELRMRWIEDGRELAISGRLPLEHGAAFEQAIWNIAKTHRATDKKTGAELLAWPQYTADALVALATHTSNSSDGANVKRSPVTLIVHVSRDEPPFLEGAGPISVETAERLACDARRLELEPHGRDLIHSRVKRCASYPQLRALHKRSRHCQYPGCTALRELDAHHLTPFALRARTEIAELILLCPRHHKLIHDHHIQTSGSGEKPIFKTESGRAITANQPHAPPR
jgi:hypothetical protein